MCVNRNWVYKRDAPVPTRVSVACRTCWQCRSNRVSDYEGRCLAEAAMSHSTITMTLTYAPDENGKPRRDGADRFINKQHFQEFIRALRKRGHVVRYLVAGEYGAAKGRAHFHAVLFFGNEPPKMPHKRNFHLPDLWPHGHVYADHNTDAKAMRYVTKYMLKEEIGSHWHSVSKKPALGDAWFAKKVAQHIENEVMPVNFEYMPPGGKPGRKYLMQGSTRRDFLLRYIEGVRSKGREIFPETWNRWIVDLYEKIKKQLHIKWFASLPNEEQEAILGPFSEGRPSSQAISRLRYDTDNDMYVPIIQYKDSMDGIEAQKAESERKRAFGRCAAKIGGNANAADQKNLRKARPSRKPPPSARKVREDFANYCEALFRDEFRRMGDTGEAQPLAK